MIHVPRHEPEPTVLLANCAEWTRELCEARRQWYAGGGVGEKPRADRKRYAHPDVLSALQVIFGTKCCYCETEIDAGSYANVEHFRPQSIYPSLAYRWENLLLACSRCNSSHKRDRFPLLPRNSQPTENSYRPCAKAGNDRHALINPCVDDPALHVTFRGEEVIARTDRAKATVEVCGLDREQLNKDCQAWLIAVQATIRAYRRAQVIADTEEEQAQGTTLRYLAFNRRASYRAMTRSAIVAAGIDLNTLP